MNAIEKLQKLRERISGLDVECSILQGKLSEMQKRQQDLDDEALKAEILEAKNWQQKKDEAREHREQVKRLKEQIAEKKKMIEIINDGDVSKLKGEVFAEIKKQFEPKFKEALKRLYATYRQAEEAECSFEQVREEARNLCLSLGIFVMSPLENHGPIGNFLTSSALDKKLGQTPLDFFKKECEINGYKVD